MDFERARVFTNEREESSTRTSDEVIEQRFSIPREREREEEEKGGKGYE